MLDKQKFLDSQAVEFWRCYDAGRTYPEAWISLRCWQDVSGSDEWPPRP